MKRTEIEAAYPLGSRVTVLPAVYQSDGWAGEWFVVGYSGDAKRDVYADLCIARHPEDDYAGIVHLQRIAGSRESAWREVEEAGRGR